MSRRILERLPLKLMGATGSRSENTFLKYVATTDKKFVINLTHPNKVLELLLRLSENRASGLDSISSKLERQSSLLLSRKFLVVQFPPKYFQMIGS